MNERDVRSNWDMALTRWENGEFSLGIIIKWSFSPEDLLELCRLHEAGKHQHSIIDLLEDCNFHTECRLINEKRYDECRKLIYEDMI